MSKLRMAALNVFINMLDQKDIEPLRDSFKAMDKDRTGFITAEELKYAVREGKLNFTEE